MKKKNKGFIIAIVCLVFIVGSLLVYSYSNKSKFIELDVNQVLEKYNNKESFVLCISQTTCSHCASYKPKLEKISREYDIELFYIDIDKYDDNKISEFKKSVSFDGSTPVTAFIVDGEEPTASNRIFGDAKKNKVIEKLKKFGFIEE